MKNDSIVVAVFDVCGKILTRFRSEVRIEFELDCSLIRLEFNAGFAHRKVVLNLSYLSGKEKTEYGIERKVILWSDKLNS